jgi:hypothetical protein
LWVERWPASKLLALIRELPEESALFRAQAGGHTTLLELLAQIRDRVDVQAHGHQLRGKPEPYQRPATEQAKPKAIDLSNAKDRATLGRFFGAPR